MTIHIEITKSRYDNKWNIRVGDIEGCTESYNITTDELIEEIREQLGIENDLSLTKNEKGCGKIFRIEGFGVACGERVGRDLFICYECQRSTNSALNSREQMGKGESRDGYALSESNQTKQKPLTDREVSHTPDTILNQSENNSPTQTSLGELGESREVLNPVGGTIHSQNKELMNKDYGLDQRDKFNALKDRGKI